MMNSAIITVAGVTPPGPGKKQGHVHDTDGNKWNVWADKIPNYRMGVSYEIKYEENEFNGKTFSVIKTANPANAAPVTPSGHRAPAQPKPSDGWPGPIPHQIDPKAETIFVCGLCNNAMANANVNPFEVTLTELIAFVDKARSAWRNTLGKAQRADDLNDEIPL